MNMNRVSKAALLCVVTAVAAGCGGGGGSGAVGGVISRAPGPGTKAY